MNYVLDLAEAITAAKERLEEHLKVRPDPYDIPARTAWAWAHHDLKIHLDMLEAQSASGWNALAYQIDPIPEYHPTPTDDAALVHMDHLMQRLCEQTEKAAKARNPEEFRVLRQAIYWMRSEVTKHGVRCRLPHPPFPHIPKTPWSMGGGWTMAHPGQTGAAGSRAKVAPTRM